MVGMVKSRRMLSVMTAWEMTQNSRDRASMAPDHTAVTLSFRIRCMYQMRRVTDRAPERMAGMREARLVNPRMV